MGNRCRKIFIFIFIIVKIKTFPNTFNQLCSTIYIYIYITCDKFEIFLSKLFNLSLRIRAYSSFFAFRTKRKYVWER